MTTFFDTKINALLRGLYYADRSDIKANSLDELLAHPDIVINPDVTISQFGFIHEDCTAIEFNNSKKQLVRIASTKYRNGFDLWLIDPETSLSMRA